MSKTSGNGYNWNNPWRVDIVYIKWNGFSHATIAECTHRYTHTFLVMFAGKTIDNCDRDAYVHSSHQCVFSPTKCYDATGTNFEARVYPARNRLAQACVLLFYSHKASAQLTSAAWVPGTGQTRI